jgi:hypothetical protein
MVGGDAWRKTICSEAGVAPSLRSSALLRTQLQLERSYCTAQLCYEHSSTRSWGCGGCGGRGHSRGGGCSRRHYALAGRWDPKPSMNLPAGA